MEGKLETIQATFDQILTIGKSLEVPSPNSSVGLSECDLEEAKEEKIIL